MFPKIKNKSPPPICKAVELTDVARPPDNLDEGRGLADSPMDLDPTPGNEFIDSPSPGDCAPPGDLDEPPYGCPLSSTVDAPALGAPPTMDQPFAGAHLSVGPLRGPLFSSLDYSGTSCGEGAFKSLRPLPSPKPGPRMVDYSDLCSQMASLTVQSVTNEASPPTHVTSISTTEYHPTQSAPWPATQGHSFGSVGSPFLFNGAEATVVPRPEWNANAYQEPGNLSQPAEAPQAPTPIPPVAASAPAPVSMGTEQLNDGAEFQRCPTVEIFETDPPHTPAPPPVNGKGSPFDLLGEAFETLGLNHSGRDGEAPLGRVKSVTLLIIEFSS